MDQILHKGSRLWSGFDLSLFRIKANENFNYLEFFSKKEPTLKIGEILHLCHYYHPSNLGDPFLLSNPIEVVGFAQTNIGLQYLAEDFYKEVSSGGAIIKNGKFIGIQCSDYSKDAQMLSFQAVWAELINTDENLNT